MCLCNIQASRLMSGMDVELNDRGVIPMVQHVYIDECGFTGADLLQEEQPIFSLSAVPIEENIAREIKNRFFPDFGDEELKHARFTGDVKHKSAVAGCLEECLGRGTLGAVFYKPFICAEAFLMDMISPFYPTLQFGSDGFRIIAFNLMNSADWFGYREDVRSVLKTYVDVYKQFCKIRRPTPDAYEKAYLPLYNALVAVRSSRFKALLEPLRFYGPAYGKQLAVSMCLGGCSQGAAFALITQLEQLNVKYDLVVDTSPSIRAIAPLFMAMKGFQSDEIRVSTDTVVKFPLVGLQGVREVDSKQSVAVQLADLVAGTLVRATYRRFGISPKTRHDEYDGVMQNIWERHPMNMLVKPALEHIDVGNDVARMQKAIRASGWGLKR